jgi:hypothetical protein
MIGFGAIAVFIDASLLLVPRTVLAHKPSDSYLMLRAGREAIEGRWDVALRDVDFLLGLDADEDGEITWGELKKKWPEVERTALSKLELELGGERCVIAPAGAHEVVKRSDGPYVVIVIAFSARCPGWPAPAKGGPAELSISYGFLFEQDRQHRGILRVEGPRRMRNTIFDPSTRVARFELRDL